MLFEAKQWCWACTIRDRTVQFEIVPYSSGSHRTVWDRTVQFEIAQYSSGSHRTVRDHTELECVKHFRILLPWLSTSTRFIFHHTPSLLCCCSHPIKVESHWHFGFEYHTHRFWERLTAKASQWLNTWQKKLFYFDRCTCCTSGVLRLLPLHLLLPLFLGWKCP